MCDHPECHSAPSVSWDMIETPSGFHMKVFMGNWVMEEKMFTDQLSAMTWADSIATLWNFAPLRSH